jgi:hypothetical protein
MKLTKSELQKLYAQIDKWKLRPQTILMDEQTAFDLGLPMDGPYFREKLDKLNEGQIREFFIDCIRNQFTISLLKEIVEAEFPQYSDLLNKLLILK